MDKKFAGRIVSMDVGLDTVLYLADKEVVEYYIQAHEWGVTLGLYRPGHYRLREEGEEGDRTEYWECIEDTLEECINIINTLDKER